VPGFAKKLIPGLAKPGILGNNLHNSRRENAGIMQKQPGLSAVPG
jgi:hypothetical protein